MNKLNIVVNLCCPFQSFTSPTPPNTNTHHCLRDREREIDKKRDKGGRRREGEKFASFFMLAQQE
jgi:hypothetical protein